MQLINEHHSFTGIQRDISVLKHPTSYLYEAHNIRLTARGEDTLLTITNEKGPLDTGIKIEGSYLGHCLLGKYLTIFSTKATDASSTVENEDTQPLQASLKEVEPVDNITGEPGVEDEFKDELLPWNPIDPTPPTPPEEDDNESNEGDEGDEGGDNSGDGGENTNPPAEDTNPPEDTEDNTEEDTSPKLDYIYRIDLSSGEVVVLYNGRLNFSTAFPIEAIPSYENENIQKVYWTDGNNQPRVINIKGNILSNTDSQFDFVRTLALKEEVKIQKQLGASGSFAPGVIQYAFTYYSKHGQESNIFYTSPLLYISYKDRGGSPEDKVENAFKITIENLDKNFDYIRVYSIQRTSINSNPIVKRVQDISIKKDNIIGNTLLEKVSFLDTGTIGDFIDPTELLYKGGESIIAGTIGQKDNTLFLGNIKLIRPSINSAIKEVISKRVQINQDFRVFYPTEVSKEYNYYNQLTSFSDIEKTNSVPCGGFKKGDYYRCGIQFQYKDGKWSDPIWIKDEIITNTPSVDKDTGEITLPALQGVIPVEIVNSFYNSEYKKVRALVVFPEIQDRVTICQGVLSPTLYTDNHRDLKDLYAQSSWFFRPNYNELVPGGIPQIMDNGAVAPTNTSLLYTSREVKDGVPNWNPSKLRQVEIQGNFDEKDKFKIDTNFSTLHSPDIEFDEHFSVIDFVDSYYRTAGYVSFSKTFSDIDIQTETPTISNNGGGFQHKSFKVDGPQGIISGLFYDDYVVDDNGNTGNFKAYEREKSPYKWMVYAWNKTGSLNNDINRPANSGVRTAVLKKKVISNLRYSDTTLSATLGEIKELTNLPQVFNDNQLSILKIGENIYQGNIDTLLSPNKSEGMYYAFGNDENKDLEYNASDIDTPFNSSIWWKIFSIKDDTAEGQLWRFYNEDSKWVSKDDSIGDKNLSLAVQKEAVRLKYKSSPHMVIEASSIDYNTGAVLPIIEVVRKGDTDNSFYRSTMFGGTSEDAFKSNLWIPCGEPVLLEKDKDAIIQYSYGDTYFQRWDCLKTYPFTKEDINQIVEIGSFMLETRINIDGRYDRNRGQLNNLNMTPQNFNLLNPIYTQINNFFTYRILDKSYYRLNSFPSQITWTKEKQSGADVDLWTNLTIASTYDMDGSKGAITSINTWKDQILCFQETGISAILFNSRVQVPTSDGIPIEISNSYKVDGYRYISEGIGCINKWTITNTPSGIYFITPNNHLYHIGEGLQDITTSHNMISWFRDIGNNEVINTLYDNINHDLYLFTNKESLCYSEILGQFTSFMSYDNLSLMESYDNYVYTMRNGSFYWMFKGYYNRFFGEEKGWDFSFISNGVDTSTMDFTKIFSNIDYRMEAFNPFGYVSNRSLEYIQVNNDYQDTGEVLLSRLKTSSPKSYHHKDANLQKKFQIWRIQVPRNKNSMDRITDTWCKIKLGNKGKDLLKMVLHDLNVQYYI